MFNFVSVFAMDPVGPDSTITGLGVPSLDNRGNLAFKTFSGFTPNSSGSSIVLMDRDGPSRVVDGAQFATSSLSAPSLDNGELAYLKQDQFEAVSESLYLYAAGDKSVLVAHTPVPGGDGTFTALGVPSLSGGRVAFGSSDDYHEDLGMQVHTGLYLADRDGVDSLVDTDTPIPHGSGRFVSFAAPALAGDTVAFVGYGDLVDWHGFQRLQRGIDTKNTGGDRVRRVADIDTFVPDGAGTFSTFAAPSIRAGSVAFLAGSQKSLEEWSPARGIYVDLGGGRQVVADTTTPIPRGGGPFQEFSDLSLDAGKIVFWGHGAGEEAPRDGADTGLFGNVGGVLERIIGPGDLLDAKSVSAVRLSQEGLRGGDIAFWVKFEDGSEAIYVAESRYYVDIKAATEPAAQPCNRRDRFDPDGVSHGYSSDSVSVTISARSRSAAAEEVDWWVLVDTPDGWYHYNAERGQWSPGIACSHRALFVDLAPMTVLDMASIAKDTPKGAYTFYLGIDLMPNCTLDPGVVRYDSVVVQVH